MSDTQTFLFALSHQPALSLLCRLNPRFELGARLLVVLRKLPQLRLECPAIGLVSSDHEGHHAMIRWTFERHRVGDRFTRVPTGLETRGRIRHPT